MFSLYTSTFVALICSLFVLNGQTAQLGKNPCTRGPGHWCAHVDNAKKCDAIKYCVDKGHFVLTGPNTYELKKNTEEPLVLGANECTWGPGFWCASLKNAKKCDAEQHCLKNKWNGVAPAQ